MSKRLLALLLAIVMMFSLVVPAGAVSEEPAGNEVSVVDDAGGDYAQESSSLAAVPEESSEEAEEPSQPEEDAGTAFEEESVEPSSDAEPDVQDEDSSYEDLEETDQATQDEETVSESIADEDVPGASFDDVDSSEDADDSTELSDEEVASDSSEDVAVSPASDEEGNEAESSSEETHVDEQDKVEEETEASEEDADKSNDKNDKDKEEEEEAEGEASEEPEEEIDLSLYADMLAGLDFSSQRLLVASYDESIFEKDWDYLLSSYDGIHLLQYDTVEDAQRAYIRFSETAEFVDLDTAIYVADDTYTADTPDMTEYDNPIAELNSTYAAARGATIALIDTGASASNNVVARYSVNGGVEDYNGHGDAMVGYITEVNPDAKIISIKALDESGVGTISTVYAAIEMAIESGVDIINISMYAVKSENSDAIARAINDAVAYGITVVGAAGNDGRNAGWYVPGCVGSAIIVGSVDADGNRRGFSNYGGSVDYYIESDSTSEAAARVTGILSLGEGLDDYIISGNILSSKPVKDIETETVPVTLDIAGVGGKVQITNDDEYIAEYWYEKPQDDSEPVLYGAVGSEKAAAVEITDGEDIKIDVPVGEITITAVANDFYKLSAFSVEKEDGTEVESDFADKLQAAKDSEDILDGVTDCSVTVKADEDGVAAIRAQFEDLYPFDEDVDQPVGHTALTFMFWYLTDHSVNPERIADILPNLFTFVYRDSYLPILYGSQFWDQLDEKNQEAVDKAIQIASGDDELTYVKLANDAYTWLVRYDDGLMKNVLFGFTVDENGNSTIGVSEDVCYTVEFDPPAIIDVGACTAAAASLNPNNEEYMQIAATYSATGSFTDAKITYSISNLNETVKSGEAIDTGAWVTHISGYTFTPYYAGDYYGYCIDEFAGEFPQDTTVNSGLGAAEFANNYTEAQRIGIVRCALYGKTWREQNWPWSDNMSQAVSFARGSSTMAQQEAIWANLQGLAIWAESNYNRIGDPAYGANVDPTAYHSTLNFITDMFYLHGKKPSFAYNTTTLANNSPITLTEEGNNYVFTVEDTAIFSDYALETTKHSGRYLNSYFTFDIMNPNGTVKYTVKPTYVKDTKTTTRTDNLGYSLGQTTVSNTAHYGQWKFSIPKSQLNAGEQYTIRVSTPTINNSATVLVYWSHDGSDDGQGYSWNASHTAWIRRYQPVFVLLEGATTNANAYLSVKAPAPKGSITLTKVNADKTSEKLSGATFTLTGPNGYSSKKTTGTDGTITWSDLALGTYTITENSAPSGFTITASAQTVTLTETNLNQSKTISNKETPVPLKVVKTTASAYASFVKNNTCYDLAGATFGVYATQANANAKTNSLGTLTVRKTSSGTYETNSISLQPGTYYVRELTAGKGYNLNNTIKSVTLARGASSASVTFENVPGNDPVIVQINKTGQDGTATKSLAGAKFRIDWYGGYFTSASAASSANVEHRTWTVKTVKIGNYYAAGMNISGSLISSESDDLFKSGDGTQYVVPYGTLVIKEVSPATGYLNDPNFTDKDGKTYGDTFIIQAKEGTFTSVKTGNSLDPEVSVTDTLVPEIGTTLLSDDDSHYATAVGEVTLTDTVAIKFANDFIGKNVAISGVLVDTSGNEVKVNGQSITASKTVKVTAATMNVELEFTFDAKALEGKTVVAYETAVFDSTVTVEHKDSTDKGQTVYIPKLSTTAKDGTTGNNVTKAAESITVIDTVSYSNLKPGTNYTMVATLVEKNADGSEGAVLKDKNGYEVKVLQPFRSSSTGAGTVDVTFTFDVASEDELAGRTFVAFEEIPGVAIHADINDEDQTIHVPKIGTTAVDSETEEPISLADDSVTILDTVAYTNVVPNRQYTAVGTLMDKATGEAITDASGNPITAQKKFTPTSANGSVVVEFVFDATALKLAGEDYIAEGKDTVAFEDLLDANGVSVATHADIEDEGQTIHFPEVHTNATDTYTESHHALAQETMVIEDLVTYSNLLPNREYTVTGTLMNKETGEPVLDADGNEITASETITTGDAPDGETSVSGEVTITFEFNGVNLEGVTTVAFEEVTYKDIPVGVHADLEDAPQTVYIPSGKTTALDDSTEDHMTFADPDAKASVTDTLVYTNLLPATEYTVTGKLMVKETGEPLVIDGEEVTSSATFITDAGEGSVSGSVELVFEFDASALAGQTLVAFERVYYKDIEVIIHEDIDDNDETTYIPEGKTTLLDTDTEDHLALADEEITVIDTFEYDNLLSGREYTLSGVLMDEDTGDVVLVNGEPITAETTFTTEGNKEDNLPVSGSVELTFVFDASALAGTAVVAFETVTYNEKKVVVHTDLKDEPQTVHIPEIQTTNVDDLTVDHVSLVKETVTLTDTVHYTQLLPEKEYTVKGKLMIKETGEEFLDSNGEPVVAETTFTTPADETGTGSVTGDVDVKFAFEGVMLANQTTVAFEELFYNDVLVAVHSDIEDEEQSVHFPDGGTTALDAKTDDHMTNADETAKIIDRVQYENLIADRTYTVVGTLMDKETGEPLLVNGETVTSEVEFTTPVAEGDQRVDGFVDVTFEFDASALKGKTLVAFETIYLEGVEVFVHADIDDIPQTIWIPDGGTTATAIDTDDHMTMAQKNIVLTDVVEYSNLLSGRDYTVTGILMDQETGLAVLVNGQPVTSHAEFTTPGEKEDNEPVSGSIELTFEFDGSALAGKTVVAFETVHYNKTPVFVHADINDETQSVHIPEVKTTAVDSETEAGIAKVGEKKTIIDTVYYSNVLPGKTYVVTGVLMDKSTGKEFLDAEGNIITSETTFTVPEQNGVQSASGYVDLAFEFDGSLLADQTLVVFENLYQNDVLVGVHADIKDNDQSVHFPDGYTTLKDSKTEDHMTQAEETAVVIDTVFYKNLLPEKEYTITGVLMDKETGKALLVDGKEVTATRTFTTPAGGSRVDGSVDITFEFDASSLKGKTFVAFETMYHNGKEIFVHADIEDDDQTVWVPGGHTTATDKITGNHTTYADTKVTIVDEVVVENILPNRTYTVKGTLMDKATGEALLVNGKPVTAERSFKFTDVDDFNPHNGKVMLEFTFDASALQGKTLVAFEEVSYNGRNVFVHADINDEAQTVYIPKIGTQARDKADNDQKLAATGTVTIVDTIAYENLTVGTKYKAEGVLVNSKGERVTVNGVEVTGEAYFTPTSTKGTVEVEFTFKTDSLAAGKYVVFEKVYEVRATTATGSTPKEELVIVGRHEDLNDQAQTVTIQRSLVKTGDTTKLGLAIGAFVLCGGGLATGLVISRKKKKTQSQ